MYSGYHTMPPSIRNSLYSGNYQGDGLLSFLGKVLKPVGAVLGTAAEFIPGGSLVKAGLRTVGSVLRSPAGQIGTAVALTAATAGIGRTSGGLPALPSGTGLPAIPTTGSGGIVGAFKGAAGKFQFPWTNPAELFKPPFALDDSYLSIRYRAPRGYVVVRDQNGRPYAMMKMVAQKIGAWKPAKKPPISAGEWHQYQTARHVEKKLIKIARHAIHKHHRTAPVAAARVVSFRKAA